MIDRTKDLDPPGPAEEVRVGMYVSAFGRPHLMRCDGLSAIDASRAPRRRPPLARLYTASRLFVNFFQPSFKLKDGGGRTQTGAGCRRQHSPHDGKDGGWGRIRRLCVMPTDHSFRQGHPGGVHLRREGHATLPLNPAKEHWVGWWIKVTGLPLMYWNYMLKGHVWFPKHNTAFKGDVVG